MGLLLALQLFGSITVGPSLSLMAQSYIQIQKQIEALQLKAKKLRDKEVGGVIERIRVAIDHYGITADQLFGPRATASRATSNGSLRTVKFSDGNGNSWSGMGKRPLWLRDALSEGRTLDEFRTDAPPPAKTATAKPASKKRKTRTVYRDDAGHTWTGMGPRPRWLKDALAAGKTLEELSA
ncbi:H-NS family nucleoid-associated regulatory protein [Variovorax sp. J22R133]|uniref:H-NS family nucleoid-associated regulatory protein n=1 Tax=Variovorax brevis TaxID=3053503 RepID=UPI00257922C3|nr:H-NS family nucleoid-associated regulatory protein [Variovorax sp. J22R133]MDM0116598.1 H-NS family nucleoid-associated regulatory protein [Variovorax sp. J22R133]